MAAPHTKQQTGTPCIFPGGLLPVRIDVELDERRYRDAFLWPASDGEDALGEIVQEAVAESGFPDTFVAPALQQAQAQIGDLRELQAYLRESAPDTSEGNMGLGAHHLRATPQDWEEESLHLIRLDVRVNRTVLHDLFYWDINNPHADPDAFARELCEDLDISDLEVAPAVSIALREQLVEIARQAAGWRESRLLKKGRRGERLLASEASQQLQRMSRGVSLLALLQGNASRSGLSVLRPPELWGAFSPSVETLPEDDNEVATVVVDPLRSEQKKFRIKRRLDDR